MHQPLSGTPNVKFVYVDLRFSVSHSVTVQARHEQNFLHVICSDDESQDIVNMR